MKNKMLPLMIGLLTAASIVFFNLPSYAEANVEDLRKQIELLEKRVDKLEAVNGKRAENPFRRLNYRTNRFWSPFDEMHSLRNEINRMFRPFSNQRFFNVSIPGNRLNFGSDFDLNETQDGYEITFNMAGFDKDKIGLKIDEHSITVKGEHARQDAKEEDDLYFNSQSYGSFMRTIPVPGDADTSKVKTEKEGDSFVIRLPKKTS